MPNGGKVESCNRIKDWYRSLAIEEIEVRGISKEYFEDLYNIYYQEQVAVLKCGFDSVWKGNCFGGQLIRRTEIEVRVRKIKNRKAAGKDEVTEEIIKGGGDQVMNLIWRLCNIAFGCFRRERVWVGQMWGLIC